MRLKKKALVFVLCGVICVLSCLPVFAAGETVHVRAEGEEGIMPLSEACPKCGYGDFVRVTDLHWQLSEKGGWFENCSKCGCDCVWVEVWHHEQTYKCNFPPCQFEETYENEGPEVVVPCGCVHY